MNNNNTPRTNNLAVIGLILAIMFPFMGFIVCIIALKQSSLTDNPSQSKKLSILGITISLAPLLFYIAIFGVTIFVSTLPEFQETNTNNNTPFNRCYYAYDCVEDGNDAMCKYRDYDTDNEITILCPKQNIQPETNDVLDSELQSIKDNFFKMRIDGKDFSLPAYLPEITKIADFNIEDAADFQPNTKYKNIKFVANDSNMVKRRELILNLENNENNNVGYQFLHIDKLTIEREKNYFDASFLGDMITLKSTYKEVEDVVDQLKFKKVFKHNYTTVAQIIVYNDGQTPSGNQSITFTFANDIITRVEVQYE